MWVWGGRKGERTRREEDVSGQEETNNESEYKTGQKEGERGGRDRKGKKRCKGNKATLKRERSKAKKEGPC